MVESACLLSKCRCKSTGGSNPPLSALEVEVGGVDPSGMRGLVLKTSDR